MKSIYKGESSYYEWDAFRKLSGKLHEGDIKSFINCELNKGNKFLLEDYNSLFHWIMENQDRNHLLPDTLFVWEKISKKIKNCSKITNKEQEYNFNRIRLNKINEIAWDAYVRGREKKESNRSLLSVLFDSAIFLHGYRQAGEILQEISETGSIYDIAFLKKRCDKYNVPPSIRKLGIMDTERKEYDKRKTKSPKSLESRASLDSILPEEENTEILIGESFLAYKKEEANRSDTEKILESAIA